MYYGFRIVKTFRIFKGKGMVSDYWIVCVFRIINAFEM